MGCFGSKEEQPRPVHQASGQSKSKNRDDDGTELADLRKKQVGKHHLEHSSTGFEEPSQGQPMFTQPNRSFDPEDEDRIGPADPSGLALTGTGTSTFKATGFDKAWDSERAQRQDQSSYDASLPQNKPQPKEQSRDELKRYRLLYGGQQGYPLNRTRGDESYVPTPADPSLGQGPFSHISPAGYQEPPSGQAATNYPSQRAATPGTPDRYNRRR